MQTKITTNHTRTTHTETHTNWLSLRCNGEVNRILYSRFILRNANKLAHQTNKTIHSAHTPASRTDPSLLHSYIHTHTRWHWHTGGTIYSWPATDGDWKSQRKECFLKRSPSRLPNARQGLCVCVSCFFFRGPVLVSFCRRSRLTVPMDCSVFFFFFFFFCPNGWHQTHDQLHEMYLSKRLDRGLAPI